jgi:ribose transport system permease protein
VGVEDGMSVKTETVSASTAGASADAPAGGHRDRPIHREDVGLAIALRVLAAGPLVVLIGIWIAFAILSPYFLTQGNITNVLAQSSSVGLVSLGAMVVVLVGSLDISLGATVGLCTIIGAVLFRDNPSMAWAIAPAMLAVGIAVGALNSLIVVTLRIGNAFIVTLGMLYVVQSFSAVEAGGSQVAFIPDYMLNLANDKYLGVPGPVIVVLVAAGALSFLLNRVVWGRWIFAIGGSPDAASKVGIPVRKVMFSVFVIAGFFSGIAAIIVAGRNGAGTIDNGNSILLAIAAVVIGGASLRGGRGSVWATLVGAVILGSITNGLTLLSVSPDWTPFAVGAVLVAACGLEKLRTSVEARLRIRQAQVQAESS